MTHTCIICNKVFNCKSKYERHLNNKKSCNVDIKIQKEKNKITCKYCQKIFYDEAGKTRHEKKHSNNSDELKEVIAKLSEKIDKQSDKMEQLMKNNAKTINIGSVNNFTNQTQNVYGLNAFGNENLDYLTINDYNRIFKKGCNAIQHFVEIVHCNDNAPENRNIYIGNFKDQYIRTFNGKSWIVENKNDVLHNLFNTKRDLLERKYINMENMLSNDAKYFFGEKYFQNGTTEEAIKIAKDDIRSILYANRLHVVKNVRKFAKKTQLKESNDMDYDYIPNNPMF